MPMNGSEGYYHSLQLDYNANITRWLRLGVGLVGKHNKKYYMKDNKEYSAAFNYADFNCTLLVEPIRTLQIDIYYGIGSRQQFSLEKWLNGEQALVASVQKSFFKNRLLLRFTYAGILYTTACFTTEMSDGSYYATERELAPSRRSWRFGLTWRFNHNASKNVKTVSSGLNASSML